MLDLTMKNLLGTGVALITPFNLDLSIDIDALKRVVNFCIEGNIDYLVVLGTTGESVTLTSAEKQLVIDVVVEENAGRLPLVVGIGGNNTHLLTEELLQTNLSNMFHHHIRFLTCLYLHSYGLMNSYSFRLDQKK